MDPVCKHRRRTFRKAVRNEHQEDARNNQLLDRLVASHCRLPNLNLQMPLRCSLPLSSDLLVLRVLVSARRKCMQPRRSRRSRAKRSAGHGGVSTAVLRQLTEEMALSASSQPYKPRRIPRRSPMTKVHAVKVHKLATYIHGEELPKFGFWNRTPAILRKTMRQDSRDFERCRDIRQDIVPGSCQGTQLMMSILEGLPYLASYLAAYPASLPGTETAGCVRCAKPCGITSGCPIIFV